MTYLTLINRSVKITPNLSRKISTSYECRILACWANKKKGAIVDLFGDGVFHFVDYTVVRNPLSYDEYRVKMRTDEKYVKEHIGPDIKKNHVGLEAELKCPIVCSGIIGFWLKKMKEIIVDDDGKVLYDPMQSTADIFNEYTMMCYLKYKKDHIRDGDQWYRGLETEFLCENLLEEEETRIKQSESLYSYLQEEDVKELRNIAKEYIDFVKQHDIASLGGSVPSGIKVSEAFDLKVRAMALLGIMNEAGCGLAQNESNQSAVYDVVADITRTSTKCMQNLMYGSQGITLKETYHGKQCDEINKRLVKIGSKSVLKYQ